MFLNFVESYKVTFSHKSSRVQVLITLRIFISIFYDHLITNNALYIEIPGFSLRPKLDQIYNLLKWYVKILSDIINLCLIINFLILYYLGMISKIFLVILNLCIFFNFLDPLSYFSRNFPSRTITNTNLI